MKPLTLTLLCALALLLVAPAALYVEIRLAGREAATLTLPLAGTTLAMWLSAVAEAFAASSFGKDKAQTQLKVMMLCKALRFLLAALLLIAYGILGHGDVRLFAINLLVCYIAVTIVLTAGYTRRKKHTENSKPEAA